MNATNGNLVLAIDCLKGGNPVKNAMTTADRIAKKNGWMTQAVSVMSPDQIDWPGDFTRNWHTEFAAAGEKALGKFLKKNRVHPSVHSKILFQPYHSRKGSVQAVLTELESSKASAVAVFTNTQKVGKSLPAGFVSSLISHSGVPVLVINAKAPPMKNLKTILFATDFSDVDEKAFTSAVKIAKSSGAEILISHILPNLANETMAAYAGITGGWNNFQTYLDSNYARLENDAKRWQELARTSGVGANYELTYNSKTIASGILKSAKKHAADLIVMTEKTGPWAAVLLGSVTRKVLETSPQPVMVIPTEMQTAR